MTVAAMFGSVFPDLDMLYFHFVDIGRTHHHDYVTHWPLFWAAFGLILVALSPALSHRTRLIWLAFLLGVASHMALDSVAAPINWLAPLGDYRVELFLVPAVYRHWILSFLLHWTFALELAICAAAAFVLYRRRQHSGAINSK